MNEEVRNPLLDELRESEERFRTICENAPVMIDSFDAEGRCVLWNRECETRLGYSQEEVAAMADPLSLFYPDREERDRVLEAITQADGTFREYEVVARGGERRIQLWADFRLPTGALISVGHDITERRNIEERLRQRGKMEAVGQLAGGIAHDFNNLLTVIVTSAELLERRLGSEAASLAPLTREIRTAAEDGAELVQRLMSFRAEDPLLLGPLDLSTLVREMAPTLERLLPETIRVETRVDARAARIDGEGAALRQLLVNLATNARDAMPHGGRLVLSTRASRDGEADGVVLSVQDDGVGMDGDTRARAFEPFFTTKPREGGTGLGLASVYGVVQQHRGFIDVHSTPGQGTTIEIFFPRTSTTKQPAAAVQAAPAGGRRGTILFVEDQQQIVRAATWVLEGEGYSLLTAQDGREALRIYLQRARDIDAVVSDAVMPNMGGRELYDELRSRGHDPKFILTSGYLPDTDGIGANMPDGPRFLRKPWSASELLAELDALLVVR